MISLVQRSQLFFKKVILIFKEKIFRERRVSLISICKELRDFPKIIKKEKEISLNRLKESRKKMISDLNYTINNFQLDIKNTIDKFSEIENRTLVFEDCTTYGNKIKESQKSYKNIKKKYKEIMKFYEILHKKKYEESNLTKFQIKAEPYYCLWSVCFDFMDFRKKMLQQNIKKLLGINFEEKRNFIKLELIKFQESFVKSFSLIHSDLDIEPPSTNKENVNLKIKLSNY